MNKFENKIKILLHSMLILVLSVNVIFTYFIIRKIYDEDFLIKTTEIARQYNQRSDYFIEALEKSAQAVALEREIIQATQSDEYNLNINSILNNAMNTNTNILGITVYGEECIYATDTVIGSNPSKDFIEENYLPENFFESDVSKNWVLRKKDSYEGYYRRSMYRVKTGIYTYISKIYNGSGECTGFLLLDIDSDAMFKLYSEDNDFLGDIILYLKSGNDIISSEPESELDIGDERMIAIEHPLMNSENLLIMSVPKSNVYSSMKLVMFIIIAAALIWYIICIPYSRFIVNSIIIPIYELRKKISRYNGVKDEK